MSGLESVRHREEERFRPEALKPPEFSFGALWNRFSDSLRQKRKEGEEFLASLAAGLRESPEQQDILSEGENIFDTYNAGISRVEESAKEDVASLLGKAAKTRERLPSSPLARISWYNMSPTPEGHMDEIERSALERALDVPRIESRAKPWMAYLSEKIRENDVVLLGEAHTVEMTEKNALRSYLETAKANGVTHVGFEIQEVFQSAFDRFMETGKFLETDDPSLYENASEYQRLRMAWYERGDSETLGAMSDFRESARDNFVISMSMHEYYPMLKRMRELGLRAVCIDHNQKYSEEEFDEAIETVGMSEWKRRNARDRDEKMYENIRATVAGGNKKMMVIVGSRHVAKNGMLHQNAGDLLAEDPSIRSFRVNIDRNLDADVSSREAKAVLGDGTNLNSVLYTALERNGISETGLDLDDSILRSESPDGESFPFDGYVKV